MIKKIIFLLSIFITFCALSADFFLTPLIKVSTFFTHKQQISILQACITGKDLSTLKNLLSCASYNALTEKDTKNNTVLHYLCRNQEYANLLTVCIQKGIPVNSRNNAGQTALHIACLFNNKDAVHNVLNAQAEINQQDSDGDTPLFYALEHKNHAIIKLLIQHKADVEIYNKVGLNPLFTALEKESCSLTCLLLLAGCSLHTTYKKLLPLEFVITKYPQNKKLIMLLLSFSTPIPFFYQNSCAQTLTKKLSSSALHLKQIITLDTNNMIIAQQDHAFWRILATIKNSKTIQALIAHAQSLKKYELIRRLQIYRQS